MIRNEFVYKAISEGHFNHKDSSQIQLCLLQLSPVCSALYTLITMLISGIIFLSEKFWCWYCLIIWYSRNTTQPSIRPLETLGPWIWRTLPGANESTIMSKCFLNVLSRLDCIWENVQSDGWIIPQTYHIITTCANYEMSLTYTRILVSSWSKYIANDLKQPGLLSL